MTALDPDWKAVVLGTNTPHNKTTAGGLYRSWRLKRNLGPAIVTAEVIPDMSTPQTDDGPHLWGVSWPAMKPVYRKDARGETVEVMPRWPAMKVGGKAPDRRAAQLAAETAMRTGAVSQPSLPTYAAEPPDDAP